MIIVSVKRVVNTSFWDDRKVMDNFSPEDKYFMLYLLTNPNTTQLGIYEVSISKMAYELGYSKDAVCVLLDRFENKYGMIKVSKETGEIAIMNYLRHSIVKGGKPVLDCLLKEESQVRDKSLVKLVCEHILTYTSNINNTVLAFINTIYTKYNENDNDNDNERIVTRIVDESSKPQKPKKPVRHKYGEYKHVLLSDEQYSDLVGKYGEDKTLDYIQYLDNYLETSGRSYKNYKQAILTWVVEAVEKKNYHRPIHTLETVSKTTPAEEPVPEMSDEEWIAMMEGTNDV